MGGGPDAYGESNRVAELNVGDDPYIITNYRNKGFDIKIRWKSLTNNGKDANIEIIVVGDDVPTMAPTVSCGGNEIGRFQFELNTDRFNGETGWELIDNETNDSIEKIDKDQHNGNQKYIYPIDLNQGDKYYCLQEGSCYTVKVTDAYGDGLENGAGTYVGYLDDEIIINGDGKFGSEISHEFCVGDANPDTTDPTEAPTTRNPTKAPTNEPTMNPTKSPTKNPTNAPTNAPTTSPTNAPVNNPTNAPTNAPTTKVPTDAPTVFEDVGNEPTSAPTIKCVNEEGTVYVKKRNNGKPDKLQTCDWIGKAKTVAKALERCKKKYNGEFVFNRCKKACGKHANKGVCKHLFKGN